MFRTTYLQYSKNSLHLVSSELNRGTHLPQTVNGTESGEGFNE